MLDDGAPAAGGVDEDFIAESSASRVCSTSKGPNSNVHLDIMVGGSIISDLLKECPMFSVQYFCNNFPPFQTFFFQLFQILLFQYFLSS